VPLAVQLPRVNRHSVSLVPPAMTGIWIVALPLPLGAAELMTVRLALVPLARLSTPAVVLGTPMVMPPAPWVVRVPVKLAALLIV